MYKILLSCSFITILMGCISTEDLTDKVVMIGKDTYQLSGTAYGWKPNELTLNANNFCRSKGQNLLLKSNNKRVTDPGSSTTEDTLVFLCLSDGDSRYTEASPETKADITIEEVKR